jgi:hypothetical protein
VALPACGLTARSCPTPSARYAAHAARQNADVMRLQWISTFTAAGLALSSCAVLFHQRIDPSEVQNLLYSRIGAPLEEVTDDLTRLGFQCERSVVSWADQPNYGCSRFNAAINLAPRMPNDWLDIELIGNKGQSILHNYRVGETWDKTYARNQR